MKQTFPYREVFEAVERKVIERATTRVSHATASAYLENFKSFHKRQLSDEDYFQILVKVAFYSGFRASTVDLKMTAIRGHFPGWKTVSGYGDKDIRRILRDPGMIAHPGKVTGCVANAKTIGQLIGEYGSVKNYIDSFAPGESLENLLLLKEALEAKFAYLGGITVYHFMTDIGLDVLKPDRVMCRIFKRLGLLEAESQLLKTVIQGRRFAKATEHPIRYIDIVFVAYGQTTSNASTITAGICLKTPRCGECTIRQYCEFDQAQLHCSSRAMLGR